MLKSSSWTISKQYQTSPAANVFSNIDKVFDLKGETITDDELSDVIKVHVSGTNYYVKRYTSGGKGLRRYMGRSRIRAEWENMLLFHSLEIPAAKVVAYGEEKYFGMMRQGALITEEVTNSMDLSQVASGAPLLLNDSAWLNSVMQQIASAMRILHGHHFIHIDFHWRNILVTLSNKPKIALIDCPSGDRLPYPLYKRGIIKDLACLDKTAKHVLSKTKRLKFYKIYKQRQQLDDSDKKQIRKILKFFEGRE